MQYRVMGRTNLKVSEIGFGGWAIGGSWGTQKDEDSLAALHRALDLGVNFIDTAAGYGNGRSERLIGRVLKERGDQDRVIVATKTPPMSGPWPPTPYCKSEEPFSEKYIRENVEERLKNLNMDRIDILQLHTWTRAWNKDPKPLQVLGELKKEGKVRFIGISTPEHDQNSVIQPMREGLIDTVQVIYNIFEQEPAAELLPAAFEHGVGIIVRVPFDESSLTGKLKEDTRFEEGDFRNDYFAGDRLGTTVGRVKKIETDIQGSGYSLPQAALKFALSHPAVSSVIPGMRNPLQVDLNCAVSEMAEIPEDLMLKLRDHNWRKAFWYHGL